jgi:hypothetical protein
MVVDDKNFHIDKKGQGVYNLDKYHGLLQDPAVKKGLILPKKVIERSSIALDDVLKNAPISYNMEERKLTKNEQQKEIQLKRDFDPKKAVSSSNFRITMPHINQADPLHKPLRHDGFTLDLHL